MSQCCSKVLVWGSNHATEQYFHVVLFVLRVQCDSNFSVCGSKHAVRPSIKPTEPAVKLVSYYPLNAMCMDLYFPKSTNEQAMLPLLELNNTFMRCFFSLFFGHIQVWKVIFQQETAPKKSLNIYRGRKHVFQHLCLGNWVVEFDGSLYINRLLIMNYSHGLDIKIVVFAMAQSFVSWADAH